jgi:RHS repeat-associated protein
VTDALGRETETEYDVRNRPVAVYAPPVWDAEKGKFSRPVTQTTYDALGQVLTVTDPLGNVTRKFYDEAGRNWKVVAPAPEAGMVAPTTITTFDAGGLALTVTNALNQTVTNSYDIHGRLITTVDAAGITNTFAYDAAGNRTSVKDGKDQETTFGYDGLNRLTWQTFANGDTWNYSYNAVQKLSQTSPRGITTRYTYDARDRLLTTSAPGLNRSYSYDATGRLLSVTEADHEAANVSYEYDALGRVTKETSRGVMHSYSYDLAGNRVRADYGTGRSVQTGYDALNRPELISEGGRVTQYGYDLAGRAVILVAGNGQTSQNSYDALGRLVDRTLFKTTAMTDSEVLAEFSWTHDALGNVRQQLETWPGSSLRAAGVRSTTMTYDANNRLASETVVEPNAVATTTTYAYDAANNRLQKTVEGGSDPGVWHYTYNAANQLTHWEQWDAENGTMLKSAALGYDEAGNRTTQNVSITGGATGNGINPPPAAGGTTSYAWDAQDRLSGVTLPDGTQHAYEYDYRTRRIGTQKLFAAVQQAMTAIVFAGGLSLAEFDTTTDSLPARPSVEYVRGPDMGGGVGGMLYSMRASGTKYSLSNGRGDIVAQADSSATLTWTASYEAYGRRTTETGVNQDKQRGNSKDEDPTGLLNEGFRYRDLETGVWLSRDPAGFVDGPNVYAYCTQNPWSFFDPKGLDKHWHHRYPKAESFLKNFLSAGIDVHDKSNGLFVDAGAHSDLHSSTKGNYNGEWKNFFESKEWSNATTQSAKKTACENFLNKIEGPKGKAHAYLNAGNAFPTEVGYETWDKHRGNTTWKSTIIQGSHSLHRARIAGLAWANDIDVKSKTPDGGSPKTKSNVPDVPGGKKLRAPGILGLVLGGATLSLSIKQNGVAQGVSEWGQDQIPVYGDIKGIINDYEGHQAMKDVVEMDKAIDKVFYEDLHESIRNHPIP